MSKTGERKYATRCLCCPSSFACQRVATRVLSEFRCAQARSGPLSAKAKGENLFASILLHIDCLLD